jgi:hypothetical protein
MERLFQGSLYSEGEKAKSSAVKEVEKLNRAMFSNPALGGVLEKIAARHRINIAQFQGEVTAKSRTAERVTSDYGELRNVRVPLLDVSIPFVGDPETFRMAPSRCAMPSHTVEIGTNALMITIPDDASADAVVENFQKAVRGNLQTLTAEYEQMKSQLDQAVQAAASRRRSEIEAEDARDKGRSFRVTR